MRFYNSELEALSQLHLFFDTALHVQSRENYVHAEMIPKKIQVQIRRTIKDFLAETDSILSDESKARLSEDMKISNILFFLASQHDDFLNLMDKKAEAFNEATSALDNLVVKCFRRINYYLFTEGNRQYLLNKNGKYYYEIIDTISSVMNLVFVEAEVENLSDLPIANYELQKDGDLFVLKFLQINEETKEETIATLRCKDLVVEYDMFNYVAATYSTNKYSWGMLAKALGDLGGRNWFDERLVNEKEKKFLPLYKFEPIMWYFNPGDNEYEYNDEQFDLFIEYVKRADCEKLLPNLDAYRNAKNEKIRAKALKKLRNVMADKSCEPLWRLIFFELYEAASEYPLKSERLADPQLLQETRERIITVLREGGYEGEYPHFRKKKRGLLSYISLVETFVADDLYVVFNASYAYMGKRKAEKHYEKLDAFGAFFHGGGRVVPLLIESQTQVGVPTLQQVLKAVMKFAQNRTLSKKETIYIGDAPKDNFEMWIPIMFAVIITMAIVNADNPNPAFRDALMKVVGIVAFVLIILTIVIKQIKKRGKRG